MKKNKTSRGFNFFEFVDSYGSNCTIQKSSSAMEDKIWFGVNDANPIIMVTDAKRLGMQINEDNGWMPYPIPAEVEFSTRMHLTRDMVKELLPILQGFVETGEI